MKHLFISFLFIYFLNNCNSLQNDNSKDLNSVQNSNVIIVYGSDTCHYCIETKRFLEVNKIPFNYFDIDKNEKALNEMLFKLNKAKIDVSDLKIPVIDKQGKLFTNNIKFEDFLIKLKQ